MFLCISVFIFSSVLNFQFGVCGEHLSTPLLITAHSQISGLIKMCTSSCKYHELSFSHFCHLCKCWLIHTNITVSFRLPAPPLCMTDRKTVLSMTISVRGVTKKLMSACILKAGFGECSCFCCKVQ